MKSKHLFANISRNFFEHKKITKYRMKKVEDMTDAEVISCCHFYCEENNMIIEWNIFRKKAESEYRYCSYLEEYIDDSNCYDLQMVTNNYIDPSALPEITVDKEKCAQCCAECKYSFQTIAAE